MTKQLPPGDSRPPPVDFVQGQTLKEEIKTHLHLHLSPYQTPHHRLDPAPDCGLLLKKQVWNAEGEECET